MTHAPSPAIIVPMEERIEGGAHGERIFLRLDLDRGADPVSGRLTTVDGHAEEFTGWIGLGAALRRLAPGDEEAPPA